jgi:hypothetical protein
MINSRWSRTSERLAPDFVSFSRQQLSRRLWRTAGHTERGDVVTDSVPDAPEFQEKLDDRGTHEFLFANRAVLCEGSH